MSVPVTGAALNGVAPSLSTNADSSQAPAPRSAGLPPLTGADIRIAVGVTAYLGALSVLAVPAVIWAFGIADRVTVETPLVAVRWVGPDFQADALTSCLLLAAVGGVGGSLVHAGNLCSRRVSRRTFESSFLAWYLLRPLLSALLGVAFVTVIHGGIGVLTASGGDSSTPTLAFAAGALAGLFLDTVLQRMRAVLGATAIDEKATAQFPPEGGFDPNEQSPRSKS